VYVEGHCGKSILAGLYNLNTFMGGQHVF